MNVKILLASIVCGAVITMSTGLIPIELIGGTHYGFPLGWFIRVLVAKGNIVERFDVLNLIIDIVLWSAIVFVVLFLFVRVEKSG